MRRAAGVMDRRSFLKGVCGAGVVAPSFFSLARPRAAESGGEFEASVRESALAAADWLLRETAYGWNPALNRVLDGDNLLRRAGVFAALARASRVFRWRERPSGTESLAERVAREAGEFCALHTTSGGSGLVRPSAAYEEANPVGLAALLVLAYAELDEGRRDDGAAHRERCLGLERFLAERQRPDGALRLGPSHDPADDEGWDDPDAAAYYPGEALYALARRNRVERASWREEVLARAFSHYRGHWRRFRQQAFIPWQSCAYAEAFLQTKRREYAEFVFEMNDWLAPLQYANDGRTPAEWAGGFDAVWEGQRLHYPPGASTGSYAESLVDALRVAGAVGDEARAGRYERGVVAALGFLMSLQYAPANTRHFQPELQRRLHGAIHASVEDGVVRVDFAQHALSAMCGYLEHRSA